LAPQIQKSLLEFQEPFLRETFGAKHGLLRSLPWYQRIFFGRVLWYKRKTPLGSEEPSLGEPFGTKERLLEFEEPSMDTRESSLDEPLVPTKSSLDSRAFHRFRGVSFRRVFSYKEGLGSEEPFLAL